MLKWVLLRGGTTAAIMAVGALGHGLAAMPQTSASTAPAVAAPDLKPVAKWKVNTSPKYNTPEWTAANQSATSWKVTLRNGKVMAQAVQGYAREYPVLPFKLAKNSRYPAYAAATKVSDGWLICEDAGEFGSDLWWYAPDGKKYYRIEGAYVRGFLQTKAGVFGFGGMDGGSIMTFNKEDAENWKVDKFLALSGQPEVFLEERNGDFLIATDTQVMRVGQDKKMEVLVKDLAWSSLYPISIVEAEKGDIYIGMRGGVARVRKQEHQGYAVEWLLPNE